MKTYIVHLFFRNSLHAGASTAGIGIEATQNFIHSDTLWAAIANNWAQLEVVNGIDFSSFLASFTDGNPLFLLSSAFPLSSCGTEYWLPRPVSLPHRFSCANQHRISYLKDYGKETKNTRFLPLAVFREWSRFRDFEFSYNREMRIGDSIRPQATIDRVSLSASLFHSGTTYFENSNLDDRSGLYFLIKTHEEMIPAIEKVMQTIYDVAGFGGNIHTGQGQLAVPPKLLEVGTNWTNVLDDFEGANARIFLSLCHPSVDDLKNGIDAVGFTHVVRKGWTGSLTTAMQVKRRTTMMFGEGSVFRTAMNGELVNVTPDIVKTPHWDGKHKVYRYGYAFSVPIQIDNND
jgi:CRISPR-associated protein Csm4